MNTKPYKSLLLTVGIHFFIMYTLVYASVNALSDTFFFSTRNLYMAMIMVAPMVVLMLWFMRSMYQDKKLNTWLYLGSIITFILFFWFIQSQTFVDDKQFLRSMIPHHSSAITMCEESTITDPEVEALCKEIISTQEKEISQMKSILERID